MRAQAAKIDEVFVLKQQHKLLAALRLCPQDDVWLLRSMCVAEDYRGQGIGAYFLQQIQPALNKKHCYSFPYTHLERFYQQAGFRPINPGLAPSSIAEKFQQYTDAGKNIILMEHQSGPD